MARRTWRRSTNNLCQIDIIFEKVVRHVDAEVKRCPGCQTHTRGAFPEDMPRPLQYRSGVKAYVLNLVIVQMLSLKRVQQSLQTLIGWSSRWRRS